MTIHSRRALAVFAKAARPGRVKTRLVPPLTAYEAATLHAAFVVDSWERLAAVPGVVRYLYTDEEGPQFNALAGGMARRQEGEGLGQRMHGCFGEMSAQGHTPLVIVGTDSPTLPLDYVERAFEVLERTDTVLGPAEDGGYYLVGCQRPHPRMFEQVVWSSSSTLLHTEEAFRRAGLSFERLPPWYDIDTFADLQRLAAESDLPPHTRRWIDSADLRLGLVGSGW